MRTAERRPGHASAPQLIFLCCLLSAGAGELLVRRSFLPTSDARVWCALGIAIVFGGWMLELFAQMDLKEARYRSDQIRLTTSSVHTNSLVTDGIYRFSRNPSYLGIAIALAGLGVVFNSLSTFLAAVAYVFLIWAFVIRTEERTLSVEFGESYDAYRKQVPRWFGPF